MSLVEVSSWLVDKETTRFFGCSILNCLRSSGGLYSMPCASIWTFLLYSSLTLLLSFWSLRSWVRISFISSIVVGFLNLRGGITFPPSEVSVLILLFGSG